MIEDVEITDNEFLRQFELEIGDNMARIEYALQDRKIFLTKYEMPEDKLKNLSVENYVRIYFLHGRKNDIITRAIESDILSVNIVKKRAKITMNNGHFLFFVKEGPYWKFEMSEL